MMETGADDMTSTGHPYNVSGQGGEASASSLFQFRQVITIFARYLIPIIIITGIVGNTISFAVFVCAQLRRLSTSVYLAALAFSDTGFLVCVGIGWLENIGVYIFYGNGICQVVVWVTYVFSFVSVWYVVCFTTEMYLSIFHSDIGQKICKLKTARIVATFFFCFACAFYMYVFWSASTISVGDKLFCVPFTESRIVLIGLTFADTTMTLIIPFSILIFMNARILILIMRMYSTKTGEDPKNSSSVDANTDSGQQNDGHHAKYANKVQKKTTKMLVAVVVVFLLLNLPSHAVRVQSLFRSLFQPGYVTSEVELLLQQIAQLLYYSNFAINFVIYNVCAKSFRRAILRLPEIIICCTCAEEYEVVQRPRGQPTARVIRRFEQDKFQNSRLVEVHLSEMHLSQMQSFAPEFVCRSPPCLIQDTPYVKEEIPCLKKETLCLKEETICFKEKTAIRLKKEATCLKEDTPCLTQDTSRCLDDTSV